MILRPGALLGLPPGFPSATLDAGWLRDVLVLLAVAAGWLIARRRERWALVAALAWAVLALGFWTFAMARPYGVLQEGAATSWAADVSVAVHAGGDGGFLAGEPGAQARWAALAHRVGARATLLAPTLSPLVVYPAIGLVIALVWGRPHAAMAAMLWLAASTQELDAARGTGLAPVLWARPAVGFAVLASVAAALAAGRWVPAGRAPLAAALAAAVAVTAAAVVPDGMRLSAAEVPAVVLLDGVAWLALAIAGLWSRRDPAAAGLAAGGVAALLLSAAGLADAVVANAAYRSGLVLAAMPVIAAVAERCGGALRVPLPRGRGWAPDGPALLGTAATVLLAGSFLTWWDPPRLDPVAELSLEPVPDRLAATMDWVRANTDPAGVFVAGEDYGPAVAVLGGRRLLRAPTLPPAPDEERRVRLERAILLGRAPEPLVRRYGLRYALIAPGQFRAHGLPEPWPAEVAFRLLHESEQGLRIYEIEVR